MGNDLGNKVRNWRGVTNTIEHYTSKTLKTIALCLSITMAAGCATVTNIGPSKLQKKDFGEKQNMNICVYTDHVKPKRIEEIIKAMDTKAASCYNINVSLKDIKPLPFPRRGFYHQIAVDIDKHARLEEGCDRNLYFIGRNIFKNPINIIDHLYGLVLPLLPLQERFGNASSGLYALMYLVDTELSPYQFLLGGPKGVAKHEFFHILCGCHEFEPKVSCEKKILELKEANRIAEELTDSNQKIFPIVYEPDYNGDGYPDERWHILSRDIANKILDRYRRHVIEKEERAKIRYGPGFDDEYNR